MPPAVADRYTLELHALAASLATPDGNEGPALLTLDREAAELLLGFERGLEPRLAADRGDLMGADPHPDDARWLLNWINRTNRTQFSRRDAHRAAPRGRFPKATDLEPALRLLEEHGYLRRVDPEPSQEPRSRGRPASPRFLVNPLPRAAEMTETPKTTTNVVSVDSGVSAARGDTSGGRR